jgi:hypothetical protein
MALDITTLADAVAASLAAFDWGEAKNVHREWLDVNDLKALATLTVLVTPESRLSASLTRDRYRQELRIEVVVQKRVGPAAAAKAEIDAILTKFDEAAAGPADAARRRVSAAARVARDRVAGAPPRTGAALLGDDPPVGQAVKRLRLRSRSPRSSTALR